MDDSVEQGQAPLGALAVSECGAATGALPSAVAGSQMESVIGIVRQAIETAKATQKPGPLYAEVVVDALRMLRYADPGAYADLRAEIKRLKKEGVDLQLLELDRQTESDPESDSTATSAADKLVGLACGQCHLFHDADQRGIAVIELDGVRQFWFCDSKGFADWLRGIYFAASGRGLGQQAIDTAIATLQAIGIYEGDEISVFQRVGQWGASYVLDLANDAWSAVVIDATGWRIVKPAPIAMIRNSNSRPLPVPIPGGDLNLLWQYANVAPEDRLLVLAWLIEALRPDTPFPVLELVGEQGTAKSSTQKALRRLVDPSKVLLRGRPKSVEDIFIAARNGHVVSYENLSGLTAEQQDALCVLATGGGFATRQFFTNLEEVAVQLHRPVILNGIAACATRPDLIERTLHIQPPAIARNQRREEVELEAQWEVDYPAILGGLLDLAAATLAKLPTVQMIERERMADFQRLGEAMALAMGQPAGTFTRLFAASVRAGVERALESSPVATALDQLLSGKPPGWSRRCAVGSLYHDLCGIRVHDQAHFPRSPKGLADELRRIAPALRRKGLDVQFLEHTREGRQIMLTVLATGENKTPPSSQPSPASPGGAERDDGDDGDDAFPMIDSAGEEVRAGP